MALGIYNLIKIIILLVNALVIINERFLRQIGILKDSGQAPIDQPQQNTQNVNFLTAIVDQNVKIVLHYPLIIANIVLILFESLLG